MIPRDVAATLLLAVPLLAAPWEVDLESSFSSLPWACVADVLSADGDGAEFVVTETLRGDGMPGDTLRVGYWEMGSCTPDLLRPGTGWLLLPDGAGDLQVVGRPGEGWWLLSGEFDDNAFWIRPGVLSREELELLCAGDTLPPRRVTVDIRFAGGGDVIEAVFQETGRGWASHSACPLLDGLELENWELALGGEDPSPYRPPAALVLRTAGGAWPELRGPVDGGAGSDWRITVFPTSPILRSPASLAEYLTGDVLPEPPVMDIEVIGADPGDLGLAAEPWLTIDDRGRLLLGGSGDPVEITRIFDDGSGGRPAVGFDIPGAGHGPVWFRFEDLPEGPSGHLATDLLDVLEKGTVTGSLSADGDPDAPRFALRVRREGS